MGRPRVASGPDVAASRWSLLDRVLEFLVGGCRRVAGAPAVPASRWSVLNRVLEFLVWGAGAWRPPLLLRCYEFSYLLWAFPGAHAVCNWVVWIRMWPHLWITAGDGLLRAS